MPITTLDGYIAAPKQRLRYVKTAARTTVAVSPFSVFDLAGMPGAGTLAIGNTANGLVPTDATTGYPSINAFGGSAKGYISKVEFLSTVPAWLTLYDKVFAAGAYAFNAAITLATQPSYATRMPGGTNYVGTEIWLEQVTASTGIQNVAVTYTNQAGTAARTTGTLATAANTLGRMHHLPLQAGDSGVQKIESVTGTVATVGTFNILVLRPLWSARIATSGSGDIHDLLRTGMVEVFENSALHLTVQPDSTSSGFPSLTFEIANA